MTRDKGLGEGVERNRENRERPWPCWNETIHSERGDDGGPRGTKAARLKDAHFIGVARSNRPLKYLAALFVSVAPAELTRPRQRESDKKFRKEKKKRRERFEAKETTFRFFGPYRFLPFSKFWNTLEHVVRGKLGILGRVYVATFEVTTQIKVSPFRRKLRYDRWLAQLARIRYVIYPAKWDFSSRQHR